MVAESLLLLSDRPPEVPMRAGLGDRFRYLIGASGKRYLFTLVRREDLADFQCVVVVLARREGSGWRALSVADIDGDGRPTAGEPWPPIVPHGCRVLVHLLAAGREERRVVVADLTALARPS
jgi:hypothetical protein